MTDIQQARFMGRIQQALQRTDSGAPPFAELIQTVPNDDDLDLINQINIRDRKQHMTLLDSMIAAGQPLNMHIEALASDADIASSIRKIAVQRDPEWGDQKAIVAWDHPLLKRLDLTAVMEPQGIPVYFPETASGNAPHKNLRTQAERALIGVTSADFALAQTASLAMKNRMAHPPYVSLLPSIHIAVIRLEQILSNLKELYTLLKWDPAHKREGLSDTMTFITGPSKTADIEATLVNGAHGPRELIVFVLT